MADDETDALDALEKEASEFNKVNIPRYSSTLPLHQATHTL